MQPRRMMLAGFAVAAVALAWYFSSDASRDPARHPAGVAGANAAAKLAAEPPAIQPRRGAGTVGARAGSLGAVAAPGRQSTTAAPQADVAVGGRYARAPSAGPNPQIESRSTDVQAEASADTSNWSGRGVEVLPPPSVGRDARDGESDEPTTPNDAPPDPMAIALGGAEPAPTPVPQTPTAPQPRSRMDAPQPSDTDSGGLPPPQVDEPAPSPGPGVPSRGPLTPAQVQEHVDDRLAGLPPEQQQALEPVVQKQEAAKAAFVGGLSN